MENLGGIKMDRQQRKKLIVVLLIGLAAIPISLGFSYAFSAEEPIRDPGDPIDPGETTTTTTTITKTEPITTITIVPPLIEVQPDINTVVGREVHVTWSYTHSIDTTWRIHKNGVEIKDGSGNREHTTEVTYIYIPSEVGTDVLKLIVTSEEGSASDTILVVATTTLTTTTTVTTTITTTTTEPTDTTIIIPLILAAVLGTVSFAIIRRRRK